MSIITQYPVLSISLFSILVTTITILVYKYATDQTKLKGYREELKALRKNMGDAKNDTAKLAELQKRSMEISMEQFKSSLKPMMITFLPAIIIFAFLNNTFPPSEVILKLPFNIPKMGSNEGFGWLGIYLIISIILNSVLRKLLKVY